MYSNKYDRIRGRWSGKDYTLLKKLGAGGIGEIYLVSDEYGDNFAMKISQDLVSITKEYDNLSKFADICFPPKVFELDDCEKNNRLYHFFIMEHIEGCTLRDALSKGRLSLVCKLDLVRLLAKVLKGINDRGYIYTDLKHENIMVDEKNRLVRVIDLGSITPIGERVKEYTPMYDRGCWKAGDRRADVSYQVFAMLILLMALLLDRDMNPEKDKLENMLIKLRKCSFPKGVYETVKGCMDGTITDCGGLGDSLGDICRRSFAGKWLTQALNAVIAVLSVMLLVLIRTVFT